MVLAPYEAICSDTNLQAIAWNLIIVDERKRMRSAQSKTYDTLADFEAQHRLLVSSNAASQVLTCLLERTTYVASIQACHLRKQLLIF